MKKILIVEDNELNMKLFFDILKYQNYEPIKALDGFDGYNKIKNEKFLIASGAEHTTFLSKLEDDKTQIKEEIIDQAGIGVVACELTYDVGIAAVFIFFTHMFYLMNFIS